MRKVIIDKKINNGEKSPVTKQLILVSSSLTSSLSSMAQKTKQNRKLEMNKNKNTTKIYRIQYKQCSQGNV